MKRLFTKGFIAFAVIGLFLSSIQVFANGTGTINQLVQYLTTKDEGSTLTTRTSSIDFVGAGVTATSTGNNVTVNIASSVSATGTPTQVAYFTATSTLASSPAFVYDPAIDVLKLGNGTPTYTVNASQSMAMTKSLPSFYIPFAGQNTSTSTTASTDITLSNDAGTDTTNYLDIGINSSTNTDPAYTGFSAGSGYMYNQSGDLVLATASAKSINFLTGGTLTANNRGSINSIGTWSITPATITGSAATNALSITQTWNTSGAPTALLMNITDTASATGSLLFNFQVGGNAKLSLTKTGLLRFGATGTVGVQNDSGFPQIYNGTNVLTSGNGDLMLSPRQGFGIGFSTSVSGAGVLRGGMLNDGSLSFGASTFTTGGTTESRFTLNGAVTGNATATIATVGMRNSLTITPNAATPLIIGYQMINSMVASANNQTFVGIDLSSTFTPGAFTGLSSIRMRIGAGSTTTVPVQFTSGALATTALVGGMEFLTDKWYGTITTGTARKEFTMNDIALTSGQVPYATTNGRLTSNSSMTFDGTNLTLTNSLINTASAGGTTEGQTWNDSTQKARGVYQSGVKQILEGVLFTQTATGTSANSTAEDTISSTGVGTLTLPANFFVAGKNIRIVGRGIHSATASPTINIKIKFGSTVITTTGAVTTKNGTDDEFEILADITCRTAGAGGTVFAQGMYIESGTGANIFGMANTTTTSVDTTASQTISVTAQWGTANASNSISLTNLTVEVLN